MMFSSSKRLVGRGGPIAVAVTLAGSSQVAAYFFNPVSGWGPLYANPATLPGFGIEGRGLAFAPNNGSLIVTGVTSTGFRLYNWNVLSGFGTRFSQTHDNPDDVSFTRDGKRLLVSGSSEVAEFNFDPSTGIGTKVFQVLSGSNEFRKSSYIWDDQFFVAGFINTLSFRIYSRAVTPVVLSQNAFFGTATSFSMSPITHASTRMLAVAIAGGQITLFQIATNGGIAAGVGASAMGSSLHTALFDPYGRLIVGGSGNQLRIYSLDSSGNQTLIAGAGDFTGGTATSLAYDEDRDILFVGSTGAPYVTAYRMGGAGFVSKFANPATALTVAVRDISLQYEEAWKYTVN